MLRQVARVCLGLLLLLLLSCPLLAAFGCSAVKSADQTAKQPGTVRFATFNAALSRSEPGALIASLEQPDDAPAKAVAEVVQGVRPDVLVLQGLDHHESYDPDGRAVELLQRNYFAISQGGADPILYEHVYLVPSNTGTAADGDPDGAFPGKGAFAILSRHPIVTEKVRTFSKLPWGHLPVNTIPKESDARESLEALPISTGGHVLAPVRIGDRTVHVLAAHPRMPPIEDPGEIRARRNHDEIELLKLIADVQNQLLGLAAVDDAGVGGTVPSRRTYPLLAFGAPVRKYEPFIIMGGLNVDPDDGPSFSSADGRAPRNLTWLPFLRNLAPASEGGKFAAAHQGGVNVQHRTNGRTDTADLADVDGPGNLRLDYVLPSRNLTIHGSGVLWPTPEAPLLGVSLETVTRASRHRLVWVDVTID